MSNELKNIVKDIQYYTDKTIGEIAKSIGHTRAYFTDQVNKGDNENLLGILKEKYGNKIKQNVPRETEVSLNEIQEELKVVAHIQRAQMELLLSLADRSKSAEIVKKYDLKGIFVDKGR